MYVITPCPVLNKNYLVILITAINLITLEKRFIILGEMLDDLAEIRFFREYFTQTLLEIIIL